MYKTVKLDEKTYKKLNRVAGLLRSKEHKPVSLNEAMSIVLSRSEELDMEDFAGSWDMTDEEAAEMEKDITRHWRTWKPK
ncbi:MAG: hypothetical protein HYW25_04680 [Candidatus Aenigmarchaeota archaeon]|nr:hypothetical protein [Candidatus Aenigmarchaeota archaeon]